MDKDSNSEIIIPEVAFKIKDSIVNKLESNLDSILLYGSSRLSGDFWDIDFLIILKENKFYFTELNLLKKIAQEFKGITLDLQFMYEKEIKSPNIFSLDAHGAFFTRILKRATPLYGLNPFSNFEPSKKQLLVSLVVRIQRYLFHARQEFILGGRHNKDRNPKYHQKHVIRSMFDLLMMNQEWLENDEVKDLINSKYPKVFTNEDWKMLSSESDDIKDYVLLYEKVYNLALDEVYNKNI
jgi:hypothetical protein